MPFWKVLIVRKKNVCRTLTKAPGAILMSFLESTHCQKKMSVEP